MTNRGKIGPMATRKKTAKKKTRTRRKAKVAKPGDCPDCGFDVPQPPAASPPKVESIKVPAEQAGAYNAGLAAGMSLGVRSSAAQLRKAAVQYESQLKGKKGAAQMKPWLEVFRTIAGSLEGSAAGYDARATQLFGALVETEGQRPSSIAQRLGSKAAKKILDLIGANDD